MQTNTATTPRPIHQVLVNASFKPTQANLSSAKRQGDSTQGLSKSNAFIATLWLQLTDIYGAYFTTKHGDKDSGVWFQALHDVSEEEIALGLRALFDDERFETWPPNCIQFRHLCIKRRKKELPSVHKAFNEARSNLNFSTITWSHPAVKFTVKHLGVDVVNAARADIAFAEFSKLYAKVCQRINEGFEVPYVADEELVIQRKTTGKEIPRLSQLIKVNS